MNNNRSYYLMVLQMYQKEIYKFDIRKVVNEVIARKDSRVIELFVL